MSSSEHKKPRLLFVNYSLGLGGIETLLLELCRHIKRDGRIEPSICIFEENGRIRNEFESLGVPVYELKKRHGTDLSLPWRVRRLIKKQKIDLLHAHNQGAWLYGGVGAVLAGCKLVYTEHSPLSKFSDSSQKRLRPVFRWLAKKTVLVTTVANHLVEDLVAQTDVPREKIRVIYNGIAIEQFQSRVDRKAILTELGLSADDRIVGILASFSEAKDHANLLQAFSRVVGELPQAVLLLCGQGPLEMDLKRQTASLGLKKSIRFLGVRRDVVKMLNLFDVFVLSSVREGLPISVLEAMAAGCPVVGTSIPGIAELVEHEHSGLLVPPKHPELLADALVRMLSEPALAETLSRAGQQKVTGVFSFATMTQRYISLYEQIVSNVPISRID